MLRNVKIGALIVMAGRGHRFGSNLPKQFHPIEGRPLFLFALETFLKTAIFDNIVLCCPHEWMDLVQEALRDVLGPIRLVSGGATRQESASLGLHALDGDCHFVAIHDGVRPYLTQALILRTLHAAMDGDAAAPCIPCTDTIVCSKDEKRFIETIPDRRDLYRLQTPQCFAYPLILEAHRTSKLTNAADDCTLVHNMGRAIHLVPGDESNMKITFSSDLT